MAAQVALPALGNHIVLFINPNANAPPAQVHHMTQFQLTAHGEAWYITILHPNPIVGPVFLSPSSGGRLIWSNEWEDGKPFHSRRKALEYALQHTKLRIYREPFGKHGAFIEVNFDEQSIIIHHNPRINPDNKSTLNFATYKALLTIPIHANALEPEKHDDHHLASQQA